MLRVHFVKNSNKPTNKMVLNYLITFDIFIISNNPDAPCEFYKYIFTKI